MEWARPKQQPKWLVVMFRNGVGSGKDVQGSVVNMLTLICGLGASGSETHQEVSYYILTLSLNMLGFGTPAENFSG